MSRVQGLGLGFGFRESIWYLGVQGKMDASIMENQMEKRIEHEMETCAIS